MENLHAALAPQADYVLFSAAVVAFGVCLLRLFPRPWQVSTRIGILVVAGLVGGWFVVESAGQRERMRMQQMVEGYAPTYARELERMGHAQIAAETSGDDPAYLQMIEAQKRWLAANPSVNDIYTMRRTTDGRKLLIVDSETDYDRNGRFEGEREERTGIGEEYEDTIVALDVAYETGRLAFEDEIVTDRWGTWVNAAAPMFDREGRVEAIVGVDFDASSWLAAIGRARLAAIGYLAVLGGVAAGLSAFAARRIAQRDRAARQREQRTLDSSRALVETSRQAGMAEVAAGVLHNVGNVLNSVNVSGNIVDDRLRRSKLQDLRRIADLLAEHREHFAEFVASDPRGKLVPELVVRVTDALAAEQREIAAEMQSILKNLHHIKEIVAMQQSYAKVGGVLEAVDLAELVEDALRINAASFMRHRISVLRCFAPVPRVMIDKHRVLQILINLIRNAKQAMDDVAVETRQLTLAIEKPAVGRVRLVVRDTGVGIAPENLTRIFHHGFTTKPSGHGFGLHSGALAASEMGGALTAQSDGPGTGATFTLDLPVTLAPADDLPFPQAA